MSQYQLLINTCSITYDFSVQLQFPMHFFKIHLWRHDYCQNCPAVCVDVFALFGTSGWGWRDSYQKTPCQREEKYVLRVSLWNHKPWRLAALFSLQKLMNSGYQGSAEHAQGLHHRLAPTTGHVTHTASKKAGAAMGGQRLQGSMCKHTRWNEGPVGDFVPGNPRGVGTSPSSWVCAPREGVTEKAVWIVICC